MAGRDIPDAHRTIFSGNMAAIESGQKVTMTGPKLIAYPSIVVGRALREQESKRRDLAQMVSNENKKMARDRYRNELEQSLTQIDLLVAKAVDALDTLPGSGTKSATESGQIMIVPKLITYPSIDHAKGSIKHILRGKNYRYYISEKIDGFQISGRRGDEGDETPYMVFTCKGRIVTESDSTFTKFIRIHQKRAHLYERGLTYHGEGVTRLRQSSLTYTRLPPYYWVLYDISRSNGEWFDWYEIKDEATRVELWSAPVLYVNTDPNIDPIEMDKKIIAEMDDGKRLSTLGGQAEGIVIKHPRFDRDKRVSALKIKMVREPFKEFHSQKKAKPQQQSLTSTLTWIGSHFDCPMRYTKAIQRLLLADQTITMEAVCANMDQDLIEEHLPMIRDLLWEELSHKVWKIANNRASTWVRQPACTAVDHKEEDWVDSPIHTHDDVLEWLGDLFGHPMLYDNTVLVSAVLDEIEVHREGICDMLWHFFQHDIIAASRDMEQWSQEHLHKINNLPRHDIIATLRNMKRLNEC